MKVWGPCPQRGPGAEPLVRGAKLSEYAEKDRNGVPVINIRTGTAFRCVPARNEPW